mmetsp:Transcript_29991/g.54323  ORF Transcript_29991/g.54323 Transcript_29991/m.54323 type:complete len:119 (+) Transcript_29991:115-471(+)
MENEELHYPCSADDYLGRTSSAVVSAAPSKLSFSRMGQANVYSLPSPCQLVNLDDGTLEERPIQGCNGLLGLLLCLEGSLTTSTPANLSKDAAEASATHVLLELLVQSNVWLLVCILW